MSSDDRALRRIPTWVIVATIPVLAGIAVLFTATMSDAGNGAAPRPATAANTVEIKDFSFAPNPISVKAGTTISVVNDDNVVHTLTADNGAFGTGDIDGGQQAGVTVVRAGVYAYHCEIHPFMQATVRVSP